VWNIHFAHISLYQKATIGHTKKKIFCKGQNNERRAFKKETESKKIKKQTASGTIHKESKISKQTKSRV